MSAKWYQVYLDKIRESYSDKIVIIDHDQICSFEEIINALKNSFALHYYKNEFSLRSFINKHTGERVIIFKASEINYLPFDIETSSMFITWQLKDVFTKLHIPTLKTYSFNHYQGIYEKYKTLEKSLGNVGEQETNHLITEWVKTISQPEDNFELIQLKDKIKLKLQDQIIDWQDISSLWGRISYLKDLIEDDSIDNLAKIDNLISLKFTRFIFDKYHELFFESFINNPVTIDKVMHYIGYQPGNKKVLICFDGMGFQEWYCLKKYLEDKGIDRFKENAVYALLPTLTKISRKALFNGVRSVEKLPNEDRGFQSHIASNWQDGFNRAKKLILNAPVKWVPAYLEYDYIGIIINLIDDIAHSTVLFAESKRTMQSNLFTLWKDTEIDKIFKEFLSSGYCVYIVSDHGSVWCKGNGYQAEKYLVDDRAKRALVYPNKILAEAFCKGKDLLQYENQNVSGNNVLVFPKSREMFGRDTDLIITHGGIHIEEVIVPFIEVLK